MKIEDIKTIGIIGSGTMGGGIALVSALNGFGTVVYDISDEILNKAKESISKGYGKLAGKNKINEAKKSEAEGNLIFTTDFNSLSSCQFIIEAAPENIEVKKEIFVKLDSITSNEAILATNTSSLSVTAISSAVKNNSRVVGMHFFNPANIMKLVEVIKGEMTSEETLNISVEVSKKLGKTPVVCKDTPAFIVNRAARPFYGEALKILGEGGLSVEEIDRIMKEEGRFAMGPFELMDLIGLDINFSVTKSVYEAFFYDPKYRPHPIQQRMVEAGMLGRKTGRGFYRY